MCIFILRMSYYKSFYEIVKYLRLSIIRTNLKQFLKNLFEFYEPDNQDINIYDLYKVGSR